MQFAIGWQHIHLERRASHIKLFDMVITKPVRRNLGVLSRVVPFGSRLMDHILYAAEGMPRAYTMIGYTLDGSPKYELPGDAGRHTYWYRLGARLGDYMGAYNLGQCYDVGRGVPRDMKRAVFWWRRAAAAGFPKAMTCLAAAYYNGEGVRRNRRLALELYGQAAMGGDRVAKKMLSKLTW
jgi:TPR repeat protein